MAHDGFTKEFLSFFNIVNDTTTACGSALERGTLVLISHITQSPVFARTVGLQAMLRAGSRAVASAPITSPSGWVIAMISTRSEAMAWADGHRQALRDLCRTTGKLLSHALAEPRGERPAEPA